MQVGDIRARIVPGLSCQNFSGDADVMRGEETQMLGRPAARSGRWRGANTCSSCPAPTANGLGSGRRRGRFHTFFTGELFAHLRVRHDPGARREKVDADHDGFRDGLERAESAEPLSALFTARAAQLIDGKSRAWATGFISGLLIGGEVREALRPDGVTPSEVVVCGEPALWALYHEALERRGSRTRR